MSGSMVQDAGAQPSTDRTSGLWPGLIRAALRVHRSLLITGGALGLAFLSALVVFRLVVDHRIAELRSLTGPSCPQPQAVAPSGDCQNFIDQVVYGEFTGTRNLLQLGCVALALGMGALVGAPVFAREFEQRTQVFSLTQSVGRTRWWTAKVGVTLLPLAVVLLAVGLVAGWAFAGWPIDDVAMYPTTFLSTTTGPAVLGVLAGAIGMTAGVFWRSTVGAVVVALILSGVVVFVGEGARPYLAQADRSVTDLDVFVSYGSDTGYPWYVGSGYLAATGAEVDWDGNCPLWSQVDPTVEMTEQLNEDISRRCYEQAGIANRYTDTIPESRFWIIRTLWTAGFLVLSGLVLAGGWLRLRRRVL